MGLVDELLSQSADLTTVSIADLDFEAWEIRHPHTFLLLEEAEPQELIEPIALLGPSKFIQLLAGWVTELLVSIACRDLGI